jgi:hypothetical protein
MNARGNELGAIKEVVARMLRFSYTYEGTVIDDQDEQKRGRVKVSIPELRWDSGDTCPWVEPEYHFGQVTPKKDAMVVVYFLNGNGNRPVYRGSTGEKLVNRLTPYSDPLVPVLFTDGDLTLTWDRENQIIKAVYADAYSCIMDFKNQTREETVGAHLTKTDWKNKKIDEKFGDVEISVDGKNIVVKNGAVDFEMKDSGKYLIKNTAGSLGAVLTALVDQVKGLKTAGSPSAQVVDPSTQALLEQFKQQITAVLEE